MSTIDWNVGAAIAPKELPAAITAYLAARQARDTDATLAAFSADAAVTDEGQTHHGRDAIRTWLDRSASEYTYTTELTGATKIDDVHFDVVQRLEGDFPGGVVDLHFRFTLQGTSIARLMIEL